MVASKAFGVDTNIYITNWLNVDGGPDFAVVVSPSPGWALVDFLFDISSILDDVAELRALIDLPEVIETIEDLWEVVRKCAAIISDIDSNSAAAINIIREVFDKASVIKFNSTENVLSRGFSDTYLTPSGWGGIVGADTLTIHVVSRDGRYISQYSSGPDDTWIFDPDGIWRAEYGTLTSREGSVRRWD